MQSPMRCDGVTIAVAATVFLGTFAMGLAQLYYAHPAEDAFILFKYAENLAGGHGIVYYAGGPRTEGASDFLWLVLLAATVAVGVNVGVAAVLWNAVGAALAAALLDREIARSGVERAWRLSFLVVPLSLPFVAGAPAAYLGFSSLLYQALVLATLVAATEDRLCRAVPWMALTLALFRPDGAFFAAGFVIATAVRSVRTIRWRGFVLSACAAAAVGALYFVGRWIYFGHLLPLPLYVKSHGVMHGPVADWVRGYLPWLKGLGFQLTWLKSPLGPGPIAAALAAIALCPPAAGARTRELLRPSLVAAFASVLFLAALSIAFQVQNVHFRYQSPVTLLLLFVAGGFTARRVAEAPSRIGRSVMFAILLASLVVSVRGGVHGIAGGLKGRSYIDVLPARLAAVLRPGRTIALTDAGRLAYWTATPTVDVAGLNYAPTALRPASVELLRQIDPDVLLIHPGAAMVAEALEPDAGAPRLWEVPPERIRQRISPSQRAVFDSGLSEYRPTSNTATVAALVMLRYLVERGDQYVIEAVFYQGGYRHVVAFRRGLPETDAMRAALEESTTGRGYAPYAALKGFPLARPFDVEIDDNPRTPVERGAD